MCTTLAIVGVLTGVAYHYSPIGQQMRNMRAAPRHIPNLEAIVWKDERLRSVAFSACTSQGGSLLVGGTVSTLEDLDELKARVESTSPPVSVVYGVTISTVESKRD
jgi:hypothetical protein